MCKDGFSREHLLRVTILAKEMERTPRAKRMLRQRMEQIKEATGGALDDFGAGLAIGLMYAEDDYPGLNKEGLETVLGLVSAQHELDHLIKGADPDHEDEEEEIEDEEEEA